MSDQSFIQLIAQQLRQDQEDRQGVQQRQPTAQNSKAGRPSLVVSPWVLLALGVLGYSAKPQAAELSDRAQAASNVLPVEPTAVVAEIAQDISLQSLLDGAELNVAAPAGELSVVGSSFADRLAAFDAQESLFRDALESGVTSATDTVDALFAQNVASDGWPRYPSTSGAAELHAQAPAASGAASSGAATSGAAAGSAAGATAATGAAGATAAATAATAAGSLGIGAVLGGVALVGVAVSGKSSDSAAPAEASSSGYVIKGPVKDVVVFRDANGDMIWQANEKITTTDAKGAYTLAGTGGTIVATADITPEMLTELKKTSLSPIDTSISDSASTDAKAFKGVLAAPAGATVVSPLTTLLAASDPTLTGTALTTKATQLASALGLTTSGSGAIDILSFNPYATGADATKALAAEKAAVQVSTVLTAIADAVDRVGGDAVNIGQAVKVVASTLATKAAEVSSGSTLDLANTDTLTTLKSSVASAVATNDATKAGFAGGESTVLSSVVASSLSTVASTNAAVQAVTLDVASGASATATATALTTALSSVATNLATAKSTLATAVSANSAPTVSSTPISAQTATQGQAFSLTLPTDLFADQDGLNTLTYVASLANGSALPDWLKFDASTKILSGTPANSDVNKYGTTDNFISVRVSAIDNVGARADASIKVSVENVNDAPTGSVTITGTASQNQTLTASNTLADIDNGTGTISYQWLADGSPIANATGTTLVLGQAQVGKAISVKASYNDGYGTAETKTSTATSLVANINDAPTGTVTISGTVESGQTLTATNNLADADGLGTISYSWYASGITEAVGTGSTFRIPKALFDKTLTVKASYTDLGGEAETVSSAATVKVTGTNSPAEGTISLANLSPGAGNAPKQGETLGIGGFTVTDEDNVTTTNTTGAVSSNNLTYQWYADDTAITGATSGTLVLGEAQVGKAIKLKVSYTDALNQSNSIFTSVTSAVVNVNDSPTGGITISGTAAQGQVLTANSTLADADGLGTLSYYWKAGGLGIAGVTGNTLTLTEDMVGKAITVTASYTDGHGTPESATSAATSAVANVNDAPAGSVTVSGTTTAGQVLTASTSTITDADGPSAIQFAYQWYAGSDAISGATSSTFTLTNTQAGKAVSVKVSYTDGHGTAESLTSSATTAIKGYYAGTANAEALVGSSAADVINGLGGNDTITGGGGADTITLGTHTPTSGTTAGSYAVIKYTAMTDSTVSASDTVTGFLAGDKIDISTILKDALVGYTGENSIPAGSSSSMFSLSGANISALDSSGSYISTGTKYAVVDVYYNGTSAIQDSFGLKMDFLLPSGSSIYKLYNKDAWTAIDFNGSTGLVAGTTAASVEGDVVVNPGDKLFRVAFNLPTSTTSSFIFAVEDTVVLLPGSTVEQTALSPQTKLFGTSSLVSTGLFTVVPDGTALTTVGDNEVHFAKTADGKVEVKFDANSAAGSTTASSVLHFEGLSGIDLSKTDFIFS